jgi:Transposase IS116/IS110/IS902 family
MRQDLGIVGFAGSIVAAIDDITRFRNPDKLVCDFGLTPWVRQSGGHPASRGRITKARPVRPRCPRRSGPGSGKMPVCCAFYSGSERVVACRSPWSAPNRSF